MDAQVGVVIGDQQADDKETDNVKDGDAPKGHLQSIGYNLAWIAGFGAGECHHLDVDI